MLIRDIMTREVQLASPRDDLQRAATLMKDHDFGLLPVGDDGRLVGMLSDRDIVVRAVAAGFYPDHHRVGEIMSPDIKYVYDDESIEDAARNMSELKVRRLPVLDRAKHLVGIVSLGDLALCERAPAGAALESISTHAA